MFSSFIYKEGRVDGRINQNMSFKPPLDFRGNCFQSFCERDVRKVIPLVAAASSCAVNFALFVWWCFHCFTPKREATLRERNQNMSLEFKSPWVFYRKLLPRSLRTFAVRTNKFPFCLFCINFCLMLFVGTTLQHRRMGENWVKTWSSFEHPLDFRENCFQSFCERDGSRSPFLLLLLQILLAPFWLYVWYFSSFYTTVRAMIRRTESKHGFEIQTTLSEFQGKPLPVFLKCYQSLVWSDNPVCFESESKPSRLTRNKR